MQNLFDGCGQGFDFLNLRQVNAQEHQVGILTRFPQNFTKRFLRRLTYQDQGLRINPGLAEFMVDGLRQAESQNAEALVIELDTPGGLETSMRQIVKAISNAKIPVVESLLRSLLSFI